MEVFNGDSHSGLKFFIVVIFSGLFRSCTTKRPEVDYDWQGNKRAIVLEDEKPFEPKPYLIYSRGWLCGWTPHGLCFSPDFRKDIHDFFVVPFNYLHRVYSDQPTNLKAAPFGINSRVVALFRKSKDQTPWAALVKSYSMNGFGDIVSVVAKTYFKSLGVNQIVQTFFPHEIRVPGAHDACKFFKTNCKHNEYCITRYFRGHVSPGEYRCECRNGWQYVRGRGCLDIDECAKNPCKVFQICENSPGSFSCRCKTGYTGPGCDIDVDECQKKSCPDNSICKNIPGNFSCTCKEGYSGKACSVSASSQQGKIVYSVEGDPIFTFQVIKMNSKRTLIIPRNKPAIVIRKTVKFYEPGPKETAIMSCLIIFLCSLGGYLYWVQRRKRPKEKESSEEKSDQPVENTGIHTSSQVTLGSQTLIDVKSIGNSGSSLNNRGQSDTSRNQASL